jgi:ribonuclease BN (tRNA processing enzyme)
MQRIATESAKTIISDGRDRFSVKRTFWRFGVDRAIDGVRAAQFVIAMMATMVVMMVLEGGCRHRDGSARKKEGDGQDVQLERLMPWRAEELWPLEIAKTATRPPSLLTKGADHVGPTRVVMLGTGTPVADPERSGPAVAVVSRGRSYVVDLGPGVVRRAAAARALGIRALENKRLDLAFVTHLHSDHTTGMADFIFTPWVLGRRRPVRIYGPPGIDEMVRHIKKAYRRDIRVRMTGSEPANPTGHRALGLVMAPGLVYRDRRMTVRAFPVQHGNWRHAYGFRFVAPDRTIVISGDTAPTQAVVDACAGCDVLVHEVYCKTGWSLLPASRRRYHLRSHTSTYELARLAARARPKLLVLYHQLLWGCTEAQLMGEIRSMYSGPVEYGRDLDIY